METVLTQRAISNGPSPSDNNQSNIRNWMMMLAVIVAVICSGCLQQETAISPKGIGGVLNLRDVDFIKTDPIPLNGEWEFYWNQLLTPKDFATGQTKLSGMFSLPGTWRGHSYAGKPLTRTGQATYRLRVLVKPEEPPLGLKLADIQIAYRLWANGVIVAQSGTVGRSTEQEKPQRSIKLAQITPSNGKIDFVLQISNHHFRVGGVPEPILISSIERLDWQRTQEWAWALFFAGSILIIGIYHLALYVVRRSDPAPLYFGLYCLLSVGYTINSNTSDWVMTMLTPGINPTFMENFALFCYMAWPSMRFRFFQTLYPDEFHKIIYRLGDLRTIIFIGFLLFAPGVPLYWYVFSCLMMSLFFGFYNIQRLAVCAKRNRVGAWLMLTGCTIHMVAGINDILVHAGWFDSVYVVEIGMFLFALFQAVALAQYTNSAFQTVARLSDELEDKNLRLEEEITKQDQLAREVVNISEEERRRISHELHDGLCQKLTAARLHTSALKKRLVKTKDSENLAQLSGLLDASVDDAYKTSRGLWPVEHDPDTPGPSLGDLARTMSKTTDIKIKYEKHLWCDHCTNPNATTLYRIAQEALANAIKHSQAKNIYMVLRCKKPNKLVLTVHDDGIGRETAGKTSQARDGGLGLGIMTHRARIIGAELRIENAPKGGTLITCMTSCSETPTFDDKPKESSHDGG